ncbi:MAG: outer membrane lipoprotein-sorting protein [Chthoniobacterales bacterium]
MRSPSLALTVLLAAAPFAAAADWNAPKLAGAMAAAVEDGDATARVKMTSPETGVLQIRIKSRRTAASAVTAYEILWPAERKGEAFVLRPAGRGVVKAPGGATVRLGAAEMSKSVFGTALAYADVIENFFRWEKQTLAGTETVGKTECLVLESRPGRRDATIYGQVRSWIDPRRMVTMRVEKYDKSGKLARRIETTQVAKDDTGRHIPAGMSVQAGGRTTEIDGANIRHDVTHAEADFAP